MNVNRSIKKSIKADKRNYTETFAEEAAQHGNMKDLYTTTKQLSKKFSKLERPVKDKDGRAISEEEGQRNRWMEHFQKLLNRPAPQDPPDIQPADSNLPVDYGKPMKEELQKAIKQLKNGKAARPDSIPTEALKADMETMVEMLLPLFKMMWEEEQVPSEWK